jgi:hypothetical protein
MKHYPSLPGPSQAPHGPCYGFLKLDGSNIRMEYSHKRGWYKFGTRNLMFDVTSELFGPAIPLFLQKYGDELPKVFKSSKELRGVSNFVVFCEWFGAKSFAGQHEHDDPKDIVLFDVNPIKKGILGPKMFLDLFGHLPVAELVFQGNFGPEIEQNVREEKVDLVSKYEIKTEIPEGVICKTGDRHELTMWKVKTNRYREELKRRFVTDWELLWE